jgi:AFG3 family protein
MGATNRLDILDPAILRPGRFDRQIKVDLPDINGRKQMFLVHMKNVKIENGESEAVAQRMAALTPGFSGAQIANVVNEAAILAARESLDVVQYKHMDKAIDRVIGGLEKKTHVMSQDEKKTVAFHEAGHAILGWFLEHADPLLKVTIIPRTSGALGFAQYLPKEVSLHTQEQLEDRMCMALGGRAAEEIIFGKVTTGARDDLDKVTRMAYAMVTSFGMSDKIGQLSFPSSGDRGDERFTKPYSEGTAQTIDEEVRRIVDAAFRRAKDILTLHKVDLEKVATCLLEKETINRQDIAELVGERKWKSPESYSEFLQAGKSSIKQAAEKLTKPKPAKEEDETPTVQPIPA